MKNKFLLSALLLLPIFAQANQVNLDSLVSNENNFCNQGRDGNLKGILSFLNLDKNSDIFFKGFKVSRIEIKNPQIVLQFSPEKLKEESKKYITSNKSYAFKNLYSINYFISFIVDSSVEDLKSKIDNINFNSGVAYKKFGDYKGSILSKSKSVEDFEDNLKTIQSPEYNIAIMKNYENNSSRASVIYQCKMVSYTNEDIDSLTKKANQ